MKIYFAGSIRGGRDDKEFYFSLIQELSKYGTVLTEHIGSLSLDDGGEKQINDVEIFERDMAWVREADVIVADVSTPSLGVGYELGQAESMGKNILCLYRTQEGKRLSAMVNGNRALQTEEYADIQDASEKIASFFATLESSS